MKTLIDILNATNEYAKKHLKHDTEQWADKCRILKFNFKDVTDDEGRPCLLIKSSVKNPPPAPPWTRGRVHYQEIRLYPPYGWWMPTHCICDCEDNMYRKEVALTVKGSSDYAYSNMQAPVITNPEGIPGACKHVVRVLKEAIQNKQIKDIMKSIERDVNKDKSLKSKMPKVESNTMSNKASALIDSIISGKEVVDVISGVHASQELLKEESGKLLPYTAETFDAIIAKFTECLDMVDMLDPKSSTQSTGEKQEELSNLMTDVFNKIYYLKNYIPRGKKQ